MFGEDVSLVPNPPLDRLVRVTVGTPEERMIFADTLTNICTQI